MSRRVVAAALVAGNLLIIATYTLRSLAIVSNRHPVNLIPGRTVTQLLGTADANSLRQLLGNLLLVAPIATAAALLARRPLLAGAIWAAVAALTIEVAQFVAVAGRSLDIDDVLLNTLGGLVVAAAISANGRFVLGVERRGNDRR